MDGCTTPLVLAPRSSHACVDEVLGLYMNDVLTQGHLCVFTRGYRGGVDGRHRLVRLRRMKDDVKDRGASKRSRHLGIHGASAFAFCVVLLVLRF